MTKKIYLLMILIVAMTLLAGCLGGGNNNPLATPTPPFTPTSTPTPGVTPTPGPSPTPSPTPTPAPSQIVITPGFASVIYDGGTKQFTAVCTDAGGNVINGATFTWSVDPAAMGTIDQTGLFTAGNTKGQCQVICSYSGITKKATVNVVGMLKDYGAQIVADTETVWGNLQDPVQDLGDVIDNTQTELAPKIAFLNLPLGASVRYLDFSFLAKLFTLPPSAYSRDDVLATSSGGPIFTGTWTVTDETWTVVYTRNATGGVNSVDTITMEATNSEQGQLLYQGTATYTTACLMDPSADPRAMTIDLDFDDENIDPSTCDGSFSFDSAAHTMTFSGDIQFYFTSASYLKFNHDWTFTLDPASEDHMLGTFETENLKLDGGMRVNYAHNDNIGTEYFNLFPKSLIFNGSIEDKNGDTTLAGSTNLTIANAATINPNSPESPTNFIQGSLSFSGSIENAQNKIDVTLKLEQTGYQREKISVLYNLTNGGVLRNFTLSLMNNNSSLDSFSFDLSSSWGPATVSIDISLNSEGQLSNVTGEVTVDGELVGTISLEGGLIRVTYTNGHFETF